MRATYLLAMTVSMLALAGADTTPPTKKAGGDGVRSAAANAIEDSTKTTAVGPGAAGSSVTRAQILLDRARFSPGQIDGIYGDDLAVAIKGYQESHGLNPSGIVNAEMWGLLNKDAGPLLLTYAITAADEKGPFVPLPATVQEKAKLKWMGYETPEEGLGEKFHISPKLLAELNPAKKLNTAGERIAVPNVRRSVVQMAVRVVVSKSQRTVVAYGAGGKRLAQYPDTIGDSHDPLPIGHWTIVGIVHFPWFDWDPKLLWNVDKSLPKAELAPGPNNPVGAAWIGLSKPDYGIHGTPDPGNIGHGVSDGCIRLTNWDVAELSHMVRRGTPVELEE